MGRVVDSKVHRLVNKLGEPMAGLEDRTGRIERAVQRVEQANGKTEAKLDELTWELRALRMRPSPMAAPPPPARPETRTRRTCTILLSACRVLCRRAARSGG